MSRSGYTYDIDDEYEERLANLWRGSVARAIEGKRGQRLLRDMAEALEAMPIKELHAEIFAEPSGECCALGAVAIRRLGLEEACQIDPEDASMSAKPLNIARALAAEVAWMNDEYDSSESPSERYNRMLQWARENITADRA